MGIGIKIDGIDGLIDELERMQDGLNPEQIDFWCKRIANDVKLKAPEDQAKDFVMEASVGEQQNPNIKLSYLPSLKDLLLQTIRSYLDQMPITTRGLFEQIIKTVENQGIKE